MGSEIPASSSSNSGSPPGQPAATEVVLARWSHRFVAWLIDFIIVNTVVWAVLSVVSFPFWLADPGRWWGAAGDGVYGPASYAITSLAFFAYWTYFETKTGQSLGKMVMHIKTTNLGGTRTADVKNVAIQSFGKAFLLPLDVILGWIFTNERRQRIFARAADTIVVRVKEEQEGAGNVRYTKD